MQDLYAIQQISTEQLLYYNTEERETEYYSKTFTYLTTLGSAVWTTEWLASAKAVLDTSIHYYNKDASLDNETSDLCKLGDLRVVKLIAVDIT